MAFDNQLGVLFPTGSRGFPPAAFGVERAGVLLTRDGFSETWQRGTALAW